jgi:uncharacterized protein
MPPTSQAYEGTRLLFANIVMHLVDRPEEVKVDVEETVSGVSLRLRVAPLDLSKVIGKQGRTARSLRTVLSSIGKGRGQVYALDICESAPGRRTGRKLSGRDTVKLSSGRVPAQQPAQWINRMPSGFHSILANGYTSSPSVTLPESCTGTGFRQYGRKMIVLHPPLCGSAGAALLSCWSVASY